MLPCVLPFLLLNPKSAAAGCASMLSATCYGLNCTYTRVRCVASQVVRLQSERVDTVKRPNAPGPSFGAFLAHLRRARTIAVSCIRRRARRGQGRTVSTRGRNVGFGRGSGGPTKRPEHVWRSRPMNLLVDMVRGMPEMLEGSWVIFCKTQVCAVCGWAEAEASPSGM